MDASGQPAPASAPVPIKEEKPTAAKMGQAEKAAPSEAQTEREETFVRNEDKAFGASEAEAASAKAPASDQFVAVAETSATLAAMVYAGIGIAVVPESVVQTWRSRLVVRPIDSAVDLTLVVSLAWDGSHPVRTPLRSLVEALTV